MKERPIIFSAPMVRAILDGRKTQTRRIVKPQPAFVPGFGTIMNASAITGRSCLYGKPGDRLWVRETWAHVPMKDADEGQGDFMGAIYKADGDRAFDAMPDEWEFMGKWRPSIHMPRWASRIDLEVVSVRVQRLNDISEEDAKAEGVEIMKHDDIGWHSHRRGFESIWESINGPKSWKANPWVWVIEFKRIKP